MAARYRANRRRTADLFAAIAPEAYEDAPLPLRHPFVFYDGHIPGFAFITLVRDALGRPSIDPELERLFNRGIDPRDATVAAQHKRSAWPDRPVVRAFADACDAAILDAYAHAVLEDDDNPRLVRAQAAYNILEHEEMHHETFTYILHRLARERQRGVTTPHRDVAPPPRDPIAIPAGIATLGAQRDALPFGWDNEFEETAVPVGAFADRRVRRDERRLSGLRARGAPAPPNWFERDGAWMLRGVFEDLPLPLSWPVYTSQQQAAAFAAWSGARLPTEPNITVPRTERPAARSGRSRGATRPPTRTATATSAGGASIPNRSDRRQTARARGASTTSSATAGSGRARRLHRCPASQAMASYPQYSADFFDGMHYVMKGASPVTASTLVRRSFRNWFYADYPFMYATFRRAYD
jgi:iron(II)-dependent oxidoreductase